MPSTGHGAQRPIAITFVDKESPITKGMEDWTTINEELYNNSAGKLLDTAHALARASAILLLGVGPVATDEGLGAAYAARVRGAHLLGAKPERDGTGNEDAQPF